MALARKHTNQLGQLGHLFAIQKKVFQQSKPPLQMIVRVDIHTPHSWPAIKGPVLRTILPVLGVVTHHTRVLAPPADIHHSNVINTMIRGNHEHALQTECQECALEVSCWFIKQQL